MGKNNPTPEELLRGVFDEVQQDKDKQRKIHELNKKFDEINNADNSSEDKFDKMQDLWIECDDAFMWRRKDLIMWQYVAFKNPEMFRDDFKKKIDEWVKIRLQDDL